MAGRFFASEPPGAISNFLEHILKKILLTEYFFMKEKEGDTKK